MKNLLSLSNPDLDQDHYQAILNSLNGSSHNDFEKEQWTFSFPDNRKIALDFNEIKTIKSKYPDWYRNIKLDLILISKIIWLEMASSTAENYINRFRGICLFWSVLAMENAMQLNRQNIDSILSHLLFSAWTKGEATKNLYISSSVKFRGFFCLDNFKHSFSSLGLNNLIVAVNNSTVRASLTRLISNHTDGELTYRDWSEGGSYNYLTLDYGQYYVEHCQNFFQNHISLAISISKTIRAIPSFAKKINRSEDTVRVWTLHFLEGKSAAEIRASLLQQGLAHSDATMRTLSDIVHEYFFQSLHRANFITKIVKAENIEYLLKKFGLNISQPNIDRFRFIVWNWLANADETKTTDLLQATEPSITLKLFIDALKHQEMALKLPEKMPNHSDYDAFGLKPPRYRDTNNKYPRQLMRLVESAGLTTIVALTGWRKSEFGFPYSSLVSHINSDKLDQFAFPYRFQIEWYVFKTSGKTLVPREITFDIAFTIFQLNELIESNSNEPCLFRINSARKLLYKSDNAVSRAVGALWTHYVKFYPPFLALDAQESLIQAQTNTYSDSILSSEFHPDMQDKLVPKSHPYTLEINPNLKEAWIRSRRELPITEFFFAQTASNDKQQWLIKYKNGSLNPEWTKTIDENISQELKIWISSLTDKECISNRVSRTVTGELLAECLYPSAHPFRHMWAEAIYRRFDGDAGWMIRSQFKHISKTMWLSYIRDKDNRGSHKAAKLRVVSSIVHNYFLKNGKGYTGQLNTWLRRLSKKTILLAPSEQQKFIDKIASVEIADVKANPWGYCLLKKRTASRAKCAEYGQPQRHNASPDLCLGCIHNLMQSSNVDWILLHLQTHIASVLNPIVPNIFKKSSYELIKNAKRHIKTLDPDHASLRELEDVVKKVEEEGSLI